MREWQMQDNGDEYMESKLWRLRAFKFLGGEAFAVDVKGEDGEWLQLYLSTSASSPREVAKEAALVALSWYRDTLSGFPMKPPKT